MTTREAFVATTRFGLGPRAGEMEDAAKAPRDWLLRQLHGPDDTGAFAGLPTGADRVREAMAERRDGERGKQALRRLHRRAYERETAVRERHAAATTAPFRERLVSFWANHFTVSTTQKNVTGVANAFEREAIRPHVTGRFADMLLSVARHPAMLLYLDNARSTGPDSPIGRRRDKGLNENLAREILELHTLGVDGGYGQADVEGFAQILTGWSISKRPIGDDAFLFNHERHQPGNKTLLGRSYGQGEAAGRRALDALASHPSTARYLARRLARHFIDDDPSDRTVDRLAAVFTDTDGDLLALSEALVDIEQVWSAPLSKMKRPRDLVISTARALDFAADGEILVRSQRQLGQAPFSAPSPQGWSESAADWAAPQLLLDRVEWADRVAERAEIADPVALADAVLGPVISRRTRRAIAAAGPVRAAVLFLSSPEFQRR